MRIRFRFSKLGKVRFTSQRDVARMWERALRRAGMPLAYTEGFSPRPQLSFGLALPTGCESLAEYLDVVLDDARPETSLVDVAALPAQLSPLLPEGVEVEEAALFDRSDGSLQQQVTSCSWMMYLSGPTRGELQHMVELLLAADSVPIERERKGRQELDDLRPSVLTLTVGDEPEGGAGHSAVPLVSELATQPRGVRPAELVRGLTGVAPESTGLVLDRACRTHQWIERDGTHAVPLGRTGDLPDVDRAPHALERAS
jgi:radical SAM-linked protein